MNKASRLPGVSEIVAVARAAIDYIDALPKDVVASLPTMPGFDRDWAENAIADSVLDESVSSKLENENIERGLINMNNIEHIRQLEAKIAGLEYKLIGSEEVHVWQCPSCLARYFTEISRCDCMGRGSDKLTLQKAVITKL